MIDFILKKRSFKFHILATIFSAGLWLFIYIGTLIYKETNFTPTSNTNSETIGGYSNSTWHESYANNAKYQSMLQTHSEYLEKINMLYAIANNLTTPNSNEMQKVIELCIKDIELAPLFKEYWINNARIFETPEALPPYPTFKRLAIIYEKQKEYQKAINVCNYAIQLGFYKDGTDGQLPGRLARLIKKARKENISISEHSANL